MEETKKNKILINCEEAKKICDKSQYNESSWWDRFRLNLRFIYCNVTRAYVKRNQKLSELVSDKNVKCMDSKTKVELKNKFEKQLQNHQ